MGRNLRFGGGRGGWDVWRGGECRRGWRAIRVLYFWREIEWDSEKLVVDGIGNTCFILNGS